MTRMYASTPGRRCARAARTCALVCTLFAAHAQAVLVVTEPWVRPAARGATTEAYMEILSSDGATLLEVRSDAARTAVLLDARGRPAGANGVLLLPGTLTVLAPRRARLSLRTLAGSLKVGDRVPLTLVLRGADGTAQTVDVDAEVRLRSPTDDHRGQRTSMRIRAREALRWPRLRTPSDGGGNAPHDTRSLVGLLRGHRLGRPKAAA